MAPNGILGQANKRLLPVVAVLLALGAVFVAIEWLSPLPLPRGALKGSLTEVQKGLISLIVDLAKLFMGWSIAIIGGAAYFLKANLEKEYPLTKLDLVFAEAVILSSVVSIFFGHLTVNFVAEMLVFDILNFKDPTLVLYVRGQYLAFLGSLMFFGAYVHTTFRSRTTNG